MTPLEFTDPAHQWSEMVLELDDGTIIGGQFTCLRVDRDSLPKYLYAYDLRDSDDGEEICQVKNFVLVNHAGTFVTDKLIVNAAEGRDIKDYSFDCTEEDYARE